jgi:hypothetical protein
MKFEGFAFLAAAVTGVTAFWGQIQGMFARIRSYVIVSAHLANDLPDDVMIYLRVHGKTSVFGDRRFYCTSRYIRPLQRYGRVVFEVTGHAMTFWLGWKPVFLSINLQNGGPNGATISFIRGTIDLNDLLIQSVRHRNAVMGAMLDKTGTRYRVAKHFGSLGSLRTDGLVSKQSGEIPSDNDSYSSIFPLGYDVSELTPGVSHAPFRHLAYSKEVDRFHQEIKQWVGSSDWHRAKSIPWRFSGLLLGEPGCGKSSFARAIAQEFDLPVHWFDLVSMTNRDFSEAWREALSQSPCIVLLEDMDRLFDESQQLKQNEDGTSLTLEFLLNCISGVESADGVLLLVTANQPDRLDPALLRAGRLDRHVYFERPDLDGLRKIAHHILADWPELIAPTVREGSDLKETGAQFELRCQTLARRKFWEGKSNEDAEAVG